MDKRNDTSDELIEAHLRALPEVEPPAGLSERVMAEVMAAEVDFDPLGRSAGLPQPAGSAAGTGRGRGLFGSGRSQRAPVDRRTGRIAVWATAAAALLFAIVITLLFVRSADTWISLLADAGRMGANVVHLVADLSVSVAAVGLAWLNKTLIALSACGRVIRIIMDVAVARAGSFIIAIVVLGVGLQLALLTVVRRRPQAP